MGKIYDKEARELIEWKGKTYKAIRAEGLDTGCSDCAFFSDKPCNIGCPHGKVSLKNTTTGAVHILSFDTLLCPVGKYYIEVDPLYLDLLKVKELTDGV